jgi:hypothetical protein
MASTQLTKSVQKNAGNDNITKMTYSVWIKRSALGEADIFAAHQLSTYYTDFYFDSNNRLNLYSYINASEAAWVQTNRRFRDTNAWYHLVFAIDTTQGTAANRVKFYVNGTQETSMNSTVYPSQNSSFGQFSDTGATLYIGNNPNRTAFDGVMSHIHYTPYTTYDASPFGSTDATTGEWKINTNPSVTYGTAGFFILKDGNSVTDQSGQSNNFTVGSGTLTKTEDCPSNVFCTMNPLNSVYISFLQGNNTISGGNNGSDYSYIGSTLAANSGKFYWEVKAADLAEIDQVGVALASSGFSNIGTSHGLQGTQYGGKGVQFSNGYKVGDGSGGAYMGGFSTDDIMMVALDLDNTKITFGKNGQWSNGSGGADQTYANSTAAFTNLTAGEYYMPAHAMRGSGGNTGISRYNFGNGYFATTAVSSAGTNASNNGIFEYDVPTGFTALSTKGLNL